MHTSALNNSRDFFLTYAPDFYSKNNVKVVDIGSQNINGSLRKFSPSKFDYIGVDFCAGKDVDIILEDPYLLPFKNQSVDIVVSTSCFEHSEMFWLTFLEILRILKPDGLFYLNAPSKGPVHEYPVDCWRFYPGSGKALLKWAEKNFYSIEILESFTDTSELWGDYVCIFIKEKSEAYAKKKRILHFKKDFYNGKILGQQNILNPKTINNI